MKFNKSFMLSLCAATLLTTSAFAAEVPAQTGKLASIVNFFTGKTTAVKNAIASCYNAVTPKFSAEFENLKQSIKDRSFRNFFQNKLVIVPVATTAVVGSAIALTYFAKRRAQKKAALAAKVS